MIGSKKDLTIKPGVAELFESNPELANAVYKAAGIGKFRVTLGKELEPEQKFGSQGEPIVKKFEVLDENKKIIGTVTLDIAKDRSITAHPTLNVIGKGYGQELYQIISLTFSAPIIEWGPHNISKSPEGKKLWKSLEKKGLAKAKYQWDDNVYLRGIDLSQQKQQALQLYSQYLKTIFPDSQVKDIVYHGTDNPNFSGFGSDFSRAIHFGTLQAAIDRRTHTDFEFKNNAKFIPALLNVKNPLKTEQDFNFEGEGLEFEDDPDFDFTKEQGHRLLITYLHNKGYNVYHPEGGVYKDGEILNNVGLDSVIYKNEREDKGSYSYAVFEQEQIHILGSKTDIEGFTKWKREQSLKETPKGNVGVGE